MPIQINCAECDKKLRIPEKYAGKSVKCPDCGEKFLVPRRSAASRSRAATPQRKAAKEQGKADPVTPPSTSSVRRLFGISAGAGAALAVVGVLLLWLLKPAPPLDEKPAEAVARSKPEEALVPDKSLNAQATAEPADPNVIARTRMKQIVDGMRRFETRGRKRDDWTNQYQDGQSSGLSWRVHLLPTIGSVVSRTDKEEGKRLGALYKKFNLEEPWDSSHNIALLDEMPDVYRFRESEGTNTRYQVFRGERLLFQVGKSRPLKDSSQKYGFGLLHPTTIIVAMSGADKAVPWTKPVDMELNRDNPLAAFGSLADGRIECMMGDSQPLSLPKDCDPELLISLITPPARDDVFLDAGSLRLGYGVKPGVRVEMPNLAAESAAEIQEKKLKLLDTAIREHNLASRWIKSDHLSWRVHLLPSVGHIMLYLSFKLDELWDSPHNSTLIPFMPDIYRFDPGDETVSALRKGLTWSEVLKMDEKKRPKRFNYMVTDGSKNTVHFYLAGRETGPWTKPDPPTTGALAELGDSRAAYCVTFDGLIVPLAGVTADDYMALQTPRGGDVVDAVGVANRAARVLGTWKPRGPESLSKSLSLISGAQYDSSAQHRNFPVYKSRKSYFDSNGVPHLSWRVHLLTQLGYQSLAKQFKLDEPWDSPNNLRLVDKMPDIFRVGDDPDDSTKTRVVRLTGPGTIYTKPYGPNEDDDRSLHTRADRGMFLGIVVGKDKAVPWTQPVDVRLDLNDPLANLGDLGSDGVIGYWGDGTVRRIPPGTDKETFLRLFDPKNKLKLQAASDAAPKYFVKSAKR